MFFPQFTLAEQRLDARQIFPRNAQFRYSFRLTRRELKPEPEHLLSQLVLTLVQFRRILIAQFFRSPRH
jgi:hypothetical protein